MNKKILFPLFLFFIIFTFNFVNADLYPSTGPCWVKGTAIAGTGITTVEDLNIVAWEGSTPLLSTLIDENGNFSLNAIGANTGDIISLKVYGAKFYDFNFVSYCKTGSDPWIILEDEIIISKVANGTTCNAHDICISGYCNGSGICATRTTGGGGNDGTAGSDGTSSGGTSSGGTVTPPSTTTQTFISTNTPSPFEISELLANTGLPTEEIQAYVDTANTGDLEITTTLDVVKTGTGSSATYKSTFTITIQNTSSSNMEDISIVEVIPKNIASDASQITSLTQFRVLVADPVIEFIVPSLNAGQTGTISYSVNENVTEAEFLEMPGAIGKANVVGTTPVTEEVIADTDTTPITSDNVDYTDTGYTDTTTTKKSTAIYWIIGIILVAVIALVFYNKKKKKGNKRKRL